MFRTGDSLKTLFIGLLASLVISVVPALAEPDHPATGESATGESAPTMPAGFAGLQIHIDPETGNLEEPTAEERRMLAKLMQQRFGRYLRPSSPDFTKDGNLQVVLGLEHYNFSLLTLDQEGRPTVHCAGGLEAADALAGHEHHANPEKREEQ